MTLLVALAIAAAVVVWIAAPGRDDAPRSIDGAAVAAGPDLLEPRAASDLAMPRGVDAPSLAGAVVDHAGQPVPDAKCSAVSLARGEHLEVSTDRIGRFSFARLPEGNLRLVIEAPGFLVHNEAVDAGARGDRKIVLRRHPLLRGRVVDDATGAPTREFIVALLPLEDGEQLPFAATAPPGSTTFSVADGEFELTASAHGSHALLVFTERGSPFGARITLQADSVAEREVRIAAGVRVRGRVRNARGDLVVEASVRLASKAGPQVAAVTGTDGSFALPTLPAGSYELLVLPQAEPFLLQSDASVLAQEPEPFWELTLPEPAALSGSVTSWTEGAAAEVVVQHEGGPVRRIGVDPASGAFLLRELTPGRCLVRVERTEPTWTNRVARALASALDPVAVELVAGATAEVRPVDVVPSLVAIRGRVLGLREDEPCTVRAFCESRALPQAYEGLLRASPRADGSFEIEGLIAGQWRVQAMRGDDVLVWQAIEVAAGAVAEVALRVR